MWTRKLGFWKWLAIEQLTLSYASKHKIDKNLLLIHVNVTELHPCVCMVKFLLR